jgi:hypothetical protein
MSRTADGFWWSWQRLSLPAKSPTQVPQPPSRVVSAPLANLARASFTQLTRSLSSHPKDCLAVFRHHALLSSPIPFWRVHLPNHSQCPRPLLGACTVSVISPPYQSQPTPLLPPVHRPNYPPTQLPHPQPTHLIRNPAGPRPLRNATCTDVPKQARRRYHYRRRRR